MDNHQELESLLRDIVKNLYDKDGHADDEGTLIRLGILFRAAGKPDLAIEMMRRALNVNPRSFCAMTNIGNCYYDKSDYDSAAKWYEAARTLDGDEITNLCYLAASFARRGRIAEAVDVMAQCLHKDPDSDVAHSFAAFVYLCAGEREKALFHLERSHAIFPFDEDVCKHLLKCYQDLGEEARARALAAWVLGNMANITDPELEEACKAMRVDDKQGCKSGAKSGGKTGENWGQ